MLGNTEAHVYIGIYIYIQNENLRNFFNGNKTPFV